LQVATQQHEHYIKENKNKLIVVRGDSTPQSVERAAATVLEIQPQHLKFDPQGCRLILSSMSIISKKNKEKLIVVRGDCTPQII